MNICPNLHNKQVKQEFDELVNLFGEEIAYYIWDENNGNSLDKAPNGASSVLFQSLLNICNGDRNKALQAKFKVYTPNFKQWFGDWQNDPENASKIVDENGEPLVVYHGTKNGVKINNIDLSKSDDSISFFTTNDKYHTANSYTESGINTGNSNLDTIIENIIEYEGDANYTKVKQYIETGIHNSEASINNLGPFDNEESLKESIHKDKELLLYLEKNKDTINFSGNIANIYNFFESLKNPLVIDVKGKNWKTIKFEDSIFTTREIAKLAKKRGYDGVIFENVIDLGAGMSFDGASFKNDVKQQNVYISFSPNQIKSIFNNGQFSKENDDIYYHLNEDLEDRSLFDVSARRGNTERSSIESVFYRLQRVFPNLRLQFHNASEVNSSKESWVQNGVVHIVLGNGTTETAIEECLHLLTAAIQQDNTNLFDQLYNQASRDFQRLKSGIDNAYTDSRGFTEEDRRNELVTQALARYVNDAYNNRSNIHKLLSNLCNWIKRTLIGVAAKIFPKYIDTQLRPERLSSNLTLEKLSKLILNTTKQYENAVKDRLYEFEQSTPQGQQNKEVTTTQKLLSLFDDLYKQYKKRKKTPASQRMLNSLYEAISEIKSKDEELAIETAAQFAAKCLGTDSTVEVTNDNALIAWLKRQQKNDFANVTAEQLYEIYNIQIDFFQKLLNILPNIDECPQKAKIDVSIINNSTKTALSLWKDAIVVVGDRVVDEMVDRYITETDEKKAILKKNMKDELHKNVLFSDLTNLWYITNYGYSRMDVVKGAFHMIGEANSKANSDSDQQIGTLLSVYKRMRRLFPGNQQRVFMEYDRNGNPTGYFVTRINHGQYKQDYNDFMIKYNEEFKQKYGVTYSIDQNGELVNDITGEYAENEEWTVDDNGNDVMPLYYRYQLGIEKWKCEHANRRYTYKYYEERMSVPFKEGDYYSNIKTHHGLSPKTLAKYNRIQSNINFYLDLCTDEETGIAHPENLTKEEMQNLDMWKERLKDLSNPFDDSFQLKPYEQRKMAYEIQAWQNYIKDNTISEFDYETFNKELQKITDECVKAGDNTKLLQFLKYNAEYKIKPEYMQQLFSMFDFQDIDDQLSSALRAKMAMYSVNSKLKRSDALYPDLSSVENNPYFFIRFLSTEIASEFIERNEMSKEDAELYKEAVGHLSYKAVPYRTIDPVNKFLDADEFIFNNREVPTSDESKALSYLDYIKQKWFEQIKNTGALYNLTDENGNNYAIDVNDDDSIRDFIKSILYMHNGDCVTDYPLSIFKYRIPNDATYFDENTGKNEPTVSYVPTGRFVNKGNKNIQFYNPEFDSSLKEGEQPKAFDDNGNKLYDNSENFNRITNDSDLYDMYKLLTETVENIIKETSPNITRYDYRLPQIEAGMSAVLSRLTNLGTSGFFDYIKNHYLAYKVLII